MPGANKFINNHKWKDKEEDKEEEKPKESDFDWIERVIKKIERAIQRLEIVANSAYKSFSKRNSTLAQQFNKVTEEIRIQQQAADAYMREANAIGLSAEYRDKVINGTMDIETIVDNEELVDKINKYQDL